MCQCLHITIQPIKSERKSESETENWTVSGNKPLVAPSLKSEAIYLVSVAPLHHWLWTITITDFLLISGTTSPNFIGSVFYAERL